MWAFIQHPWNSKGKKPPKWFDFGRLNGTDWVRVLWSIALIRLRPPMTWWGGKSCLQASLVGLGLGVC